MPGSGPTDPDKVIEAIHGGAQHDAGNDCLLVADAPTWLRVDGTAWELSSSPDVAIERDVFDALALATPEGALLRIGGVLYALEPCPVDGKTYATLLPA